MTASWINRVRGASVVETARELGLQPVKKGATFSIPCPACAAERRHTKRRDKRGAAGIRADGKGWRCFQCDASGDALDLVSFAENGCKLSDADKDGFARVREWFGLETSPHSAKVLYSQKHTVTKQQRPKDTQSQSNIASKQQNAIITERQRLETVDFWKTCSDVTECADVAAYLQRRSLDPDFVKRFQLARAVPQALDGRIAATWKKSHTEGVRPPRFDWSGFGGKTNDHGTWKPFRPWSLVGCRLVVRLFDMQARPASLIQRSIAQPNATFPPKSPAPRGMNRQGLVMANDRGLLTLCAAVEGADPGVRDFILAEGEVDFLTAVQVYAPNPRDNPPAVFGFVQGSLSAALFAIIPNGSTVYSYADNDKDGDKYHATIHAALDARCFVRRYQPPTPPSLPMPR